MKYCTYIIFSISKDRFYIGSTCNLEDRLLKHNGKHSGYTGKVNDWELVWSKEFDNKMEATGLEKKIKRWKSRHMIEKLIKKSTT